MSEIFKPSRWRLGNWFCPTSIEVTYRAVIRHRRNGAKIEEKCLSFEKLQAIKIRRGLLWSDLLLEGTANDESLTSRGHSKTEARRIFELIEARRASRQNHGIVRVVNSRPVNTRGIFVQGCARSGNTLMRELCVAGFARMELLKISAEQAECSLEHLVESLDKAPGGRILVASRNQPASLAMDTEQLRRRPDLKVIWMLRHPFDVLTSVHKINPGTFYVKPERLLTSLRLLQKFKNEEQVFAVHYEDVVRDPEAVQDKIAAAFNLDPKRSFIRCHAHFSNVPESVTALHGVRPIDARSVGRWRNDSSYREYLRAALKDFPDILSLSRENGYDVDLVED